jgi:hypothetical protein
MCGVAAALWRRVTLGGDLLGVVWSVSIRPLLIGETRMKFRSASVRISYALLYLWEISRFLSTQGARGLLAFNLTLI